MKEAARAILGMGPRHVVVKGGHLGRVSADVLFDGSEVAEFHAERVETKHTHGTGCVFASAIAACLAQGLSVRESVATAKEFVTAAIRGGLAIGKGSGDRQGLRTSQSDGGAGRRYLQDEHEMI